MNNTLKKLGCVFVKVMAILTLCFLLFWGGSLARIWILTNRHAHEFTYGYRQTRMLDDGLPDRIRVISYFEDKAIVYYSQRAGSRNELPRSGVGVLVTFSRTDSGWLLYSWEVIWSASGSADGFIWPLIR